MIYNIVVLLIKNDERKFHFMDNKENNFSPGQQSINSKNPFDNFTEYEDYNSDYHDIVPQLDIPGCVIPFEPSRDEKKNIRHYFNIAGGAMLVHLLASYGIMILLRLILKHIVMKRDGVSSSEATVQYLRGLDNFFDNSSIGIGINMLVLGFLSIIIFLIGSKISGIKIESYFKTKNLTFRELLSYGIISFFIRYIGGIAGTAFGAVFSGADMSVGREMMNYKSPRTITVMLVYACFVAPLTEEIMYRGLILKNLSRVSQRFGIIMSALLFGLMHGNVSQFIFAFFMGIFFAHIDIKHNSLLPSMIIHSFVNIISSAISYSGLLDSMTGVFIAGLLMMTMGVVGIFLFIRFHKSDRLPYTMPHQKRRNSSAFSSVLLVMTIALHLFLTIVNSFPAFSEKLFG